MSIYEAALLGLLQGATEFLPVSSSGHLIALPLLLGYKGQPLFFDTTMHLATALALIIFFAKDLAVYLKAFIRDIVLKRMSIGTYTKEGKILWYVLLGCIPAGLLGLAYGDFIENTFRGVFWVAIFLICGSLLMAFGDAMFIRFKGGSQLTILKTLLIGLSQALALFPGFSRSGSTIAGGMLAGLSREEATKFSFLVSIPIVVLAGLLQLVRSAGDINQVGLLPMVVGFGSSFLAGMAAIKFMLSYVKGNSFILFIGYRIVLAVVLLLAVL